MTPSRDEREALVKREIDESIEGIAHCSMLIARIESEKMRGNFTESDSRSFAAFHESIRKYRNNLAALTAHPSAAETVAQVLSIDEQSKVIPNETFVAIVPHGQSAPPIGTKLYAHPAQPAESVGDGGRKAYEDCIAKLQGLQINLTDVPEYAADYAARVAKATLLGCISEIRQRVASLPAAPTPAASGRDGLTENGGK